MQHQPNQSVVAEERRITQYMGISQQLSTLPADLALAELVRM
jgi:hypothetical protein